MIYKTLAMQRMEAQQGRPIEDILWDLYVSRDMTIPEVATYLGISNTSVHSWLKRCGIERRRVRYEFPDVARIRGTASGD